MLIYNNQKKGKKMTDLFEKLAKAVETVEPIDTETALEILNIDNVDFPMLLGFANKLRVKTQGEKIHICTIMNAKSGACGEDCAFCAQSGHHNTLIDVYPMKDGETIAKTYEHIPKDTHCFGVVTAGGGLSSDDINIFADTVAKTKTGIAWSASFGIISDEQLLKLKDAGLSRYHHNIETAKNFYPQICSTQSHELRVDMAKRVKKTGLSLCCGGIMGVGESKMQRVELAFELNEIGSDIIPLNFLVAIKGTKLENIPQVKSLDILKTVAMFRFVNPKTEIKLAGGRVHLRDLQSMLFFAGANSLITGGLLTTVNGKTDDDRKMLADLELEISQ
jgi:biotin synthase